MNIVLAKTDDFDTVKTITQTTIRTVYPHYYPAGAVDFFCEHHSDESIKKDIEEGNVYLLIDDGKTTGTVTINGNEINRLFVLPSEQHKGFGRALMDFAEAKILEHFNDIELSASFPAKHIYLKRGYKETEYHVIDTANGDHLCFDYMKKNKV